MLSIPTARLGNRLVLDPRPLIPILVAWGVAMVVIGAGGRHRVRRPALRPLHRPAVDHHRPGRLPGLRVRPLRRRRHLRRPLLQPGPRPGERMAQSVGDGHQPQHYGVQLGDGWFGLGSGGIGGTGLGLDQLRRHHPRADLSDMIFAAIGIEMGMIGAAAVAFAYTLLVGAGLRIAQTARSDFSRLMATGLTIIIGLPGLLHHGRRGAASSPSPASPCRSWPTGARRSWPTTSSSRSSCASPTRGRRRPRPRSPRAWPNRASDRWCRPADRLTGPAVSLLGHHVARASPAGARPPGSAPAPACAGPAPARPRDGRRCAPARSGAMRSSSAR